MTNKPINDITYPLVTIVITAFGPPLLLRRAILSCLNQTYKNIEIIIVDDNGFSSNYHLETRKLVEQLKNQGNQNIIKYIVHETNKNGSAARNTGINNSNGKYITFLDSDDVILPRRIERSVFSIECSDFHAVFCDVVLIRSNKILGIHNINLYGNCWKDVLINDNAMGTGSNLFLLKKAIDVIGPFDVSFIRHQDVEYMVRFLKKFKAVSIHKVEVIKDISLSLNAPSFTKLMDVRTHFESVFSDYISMLNTDEHRSFDANRFRLLTRAAILSHYRVGLNTICTVSHVSISTYIFLVISYYLHSFITLTNINRSFADQFHNLVMRHKIDNKLIHEIDISISL